VLLYATFVSLSSAESRDFGDLSRVVRIALQPRMSLIPMNGRTVCTKALSPAPCSGGFARLNALVRESARHVPHHSFIASFDDSSRLVLFHPDGFGLNMRFIHRSSAQAFVMDSDVAFSKRGAYGFFANSTLKPILTNVNFRADEALEDQHTRIGIARAGPYTVAVLNLFDSNYRGRDVVDEVEMLKFLVPLAQRHHQPDVIVVKMSKPRSWTRPLLEHIPVDIPFCTLLKRNNGRGDRRR
jgi:hypothetical protein